jgi:predicted nucleic acid-binding protein
MARRIRKSAISAEQAPRIFFDANVIIEAGKPPGGPILARVVDLVRAGLIRVLTTDLTKTEVAKKHSRNDYEVIKEVGRKHFRAIVHDVTGVHLPVLSKGEVYSRIFERYLNETNKMFDALQAETLAIDAVKPSQVFDDYAREKGFFSGEGKKNQFPDAFIFACLRQEATEQGPIIIVSQDGDYIHPVQSEMHISILSSIPELFTRLGLRVDAPDVEELLEMENDAALEAIDSELKNWSLQATDVEDAEIDVDSVTAIEFLETISFGKAKKSDDILVIGSVSIKAVVSYTHPDWDNASYDSEDKVLIPHDDVSGETEINVTAQFSMNIKADDDGTPSEIEEVRFTDDDFIWVELHPYEDYK